MQVGEVRGQFIINEGNAVSDTEGTGFLPADDIYEGFDYGVIPFSGNTNQPNGGSPGLPPFFPPGPDVPPGNPFPTDLSDESGTQTTFVDGFDLDNNPRGFSRIQFNGGEWIELAVTEDHADLRGYTIYWQDNANSAGAFGQLGITIGAAVGNAQTINERGAVTFSDDPAWANLRAGTIITITEQASADEVRDEFPFGPANTDLDDTGFDYDLSTDLSFEPFDGADDWHINFHLDETVTNGASPADTQFFRANSDLEVSNDDWAARLFDPSSNLIDNVLNPELTLADLDRETGAITDFIGENSSGVTGDFGNETNAGGVGDDEAITLLVNPDSEDTGNAFYEDVDWSTFGLPNLFNGRDANNDGVFENSDIVSGAFNDETTLSQVQDFSGLRDDIVRANTYEFVAGSTDFSQAASFQLANDDTAPAAGPDTTWSVLLRTDSGAEEVAEVSADTTINFLEVSAASGSVTLDVQSGVTLTVDGDVQPGRVLVDDGGVIGGDGTIVATEVELFGGATAPGSAAPGSGVGELTISGDYLQGADAALEIEVGGFADGEFDVLSILGDAVLDGELVISLVDGFTPPPSGVIEVLTAASVTGDLRLAGDANGFSLLIDSNGVSLEFVASVLAGDYNGDGVVDAADYTVWRDNLGAPEGTLVNDVDGGEIGDAQYLTWVANFGQGASANAGVSSVQVPEPGGAVLMLLVGAAATRRRR